MAEATVKSLAAELKTLREKVEKAELWLRVLVIVAAVFGIAGGVGGWLLGSARDQLVKLDRGILDAAGNLEASKRELTRFTTLKSEEISTTAASAVSATAGNVGARIAAMESRAAGFGSQPESRLSDPLNGLVRDVMSAGCPPGKVVREIKLHVGGTCNHSCDNDGRPLVKAEVVCVKL